MKRSNSWAGSWLILSLILFAVAVTSCVRPLPDNETSVLELEATAAFEQAVENTPKPTEAATVPPTPTKELETPVPEEEPTSTPEPSPTAEPVEIVASIIITSPIEGSILDITKPITVTGTGEGLPEGNVAIQIKKADGAIVASAATILNGVNAGFGGAGNWEAVLTLTETPGDDGMIYAFSMSPADGSILADDSVDVQFVDSGRGPFIEISSPEAGERVAEGPILVSGIGGGLFEGTLVVQAKDINGGILLTEPIILQGEDVGVGGTGTWQVSLDLIAAPGSPISILAFATSPRDGSITASASVDVLYGGEEGTVVHLVQRGETLGTISIQYGVPIQEIMTANGLTNADYIYAGQQLIIPAP